MKVATITQYGNPSVFKIDELPTPACDAKQILIKVQAASVNPIDCKIRRGKLKFIFPLKFPATLGFDIAGEVVNIGDQVQRFRVGDFVYAFSDQYPGYGYSQYITLNEEMVEPAPQNLNAYQAACFPLAAETALQALRDIAQLRMGQEVLIIGASGGVGIFAIQLAKIFGGHVSAVCSARNTELIKELGADTIINYENTDISTLTRKFDLVFDVVAKHSFAKMKKLLTPRGIYITTLPSTSNLLAMLMTQFTQKKCHIMLTKNNPQDLRFITELIEENKMKAVIDSIFKLEDIVAAHERSESEHAHGKIIINPFYEDTVEEASEESFPASDSPAWITHLDTQ